MLIVLSLADRSFSSSAGSKVTYWPAAKLVAADDLVLPQFPVDGADLLVLNPAAALAVELVELHVALQAVAGGERPHRHGDEAEADEAGPDGTRSHGVALGAEEPRVSPSLD
jgi:hypothetical protein